MPLFKFRKIVLLFTVKEMNGHLETCCSDPLCTVKMKQAAEDLMEANQKINQLKIKLAEWQTLNRFGQLTNFLDS